MRQQNTYKKILSGVTIFHLFIQIIGGILINMFIFSPNTASAANEKVLDTLSTPAAAAYSLRKLRDVYTGPAVQVRRSSDNTTQDIGFTASGELDQEALLNFVVPNFMINSSLSGIVVSNIPTPPGVTRQIVATGSNSITIRWYGTPTDAFYSTAFVSFTPALSAPIGSKFVLKQTLSLVAGSMANTSGVIQRIGNDGSVALNLTSTPTNYVSYATLTSTNAQPLNFRFSTTLGQPIDFTIKFDNLQMNAGSTVLPYVSSSLTSYPSGYISTWYDQSGNGKHATQATASKQPMIVNSGLIYNIGSRPSLYVNNNQLTFSSTPTGTVVGVVSVDTTVHSLGTLISVTGQDKNIRRTITQANGWRAVSSTPSGADLVIQTGSFVNGVAANGSSDAAPMVTQGYNTPSVLTFNTYFAPTPYANFGTLFFSTPTIGRYFVGSVPEIILFPHTGTLATSDRQTLEKNQSQYYSIALAPSAPTAVSATGGNAQATVSFTAPTDNGGSPITGYTVTSSPGGITATGTTSPITVTGLTNGTAYTFTVVATNTAGNSTASTASNSVTPIIPDTTPPTASVAYSTLLSTSGSVTATLTGASEPITITNNGGSIEYIFTAIGSFIFEFIDSFGNTGSATATVNNIDTTAPVITLSGSTSVTIAHGSSYTDLGATWSDNMDGTGSIIANGTVNTNALGTYTLTYDKIDAAGNSATTVTRTVTVTDQTAPVITLNGNASVSVAQNSSYTDAGAVWTDNIDSGGNIVANGSVDTFTLGTYTLTYDVTDTAGNTAVQKTRTVTVIDQESPTATVSYSSVLPTNTSVVATLTGESEPITITNNGGSSTYTFTSNGSFTFEFTDASGNTGSATATVSNIDTTAPTATVSYSSVLPTNTSVVATLTGESEPITITNNGGSSNSTFTVNGTFTFEFTDAAGNTGSATATVTNIDTTAPTATVSYDTLLSTSGSVVATLTGESEPITITNNSGNPTYTFTNNGTFTFEFTDAAGNTGSAIATVNNIDTIAPVITLVGDSNISVFQGSSYTDLGATWSDNTDGTGSLIASGSVDTSLLGNFSLTYDKTDAAGNTATTVTRTVTVLAVPVVQSSGGGGGWGGGPSNSNVRNIDTVTSSVGSEKTPTNTKDTVHTDKNGENNTEKNKEDNTDKSSENSIVDTTTTFLQDMGEKVGELLGIDTSSPETELNSAEENMKGEETSMNAQTGDSTQALVFEVVPQQEKEFVSIPREYNRCLSLELLQINPNDTTNYSDISESPYKRSIQKLEQAGVINGVKQDKTNEILYVPKQAVTRAEFIKVLLRTHCQEYTQESEDTIPFSDLSIGTWQYDVMRKAKNLGLIAGYDDGTFRPDETITKIEALKIMLRMALQKVSDGKSEEYSDISEDWQKRYIYQSLRAGILPSSEESLFRPNTTLSREEFADMVLKLTQIYD